jgi:uncharacterized membrane protein YeaQ/YmgE (transglycosylase-associated protein family)
VHRNFLGNGINPYIWCVVGAAVGWLATQMMAEPGRVVLIENILAGVFGAFIGGDFIASQFNNGVVNNKDFQVSSLALAIGSAVVVLLMLKLMRRVVGPMRAGKSPSRKRD